MQKLRHPTSPLYLCIFCSRLSLTKNMPVLDGAYRCSECLCPFALVSEREVAALQFMVPLASSFDLQGALFGEPVKKLPRPVCHNFPLRGALCVVCISCNRAGAADLFSVYLVSGGTGRWACKRCEKVSLVPVSKSQLDDPDWYRNRLAWLRSQA